MSKKESNPPPPPGAIKPPPPTEPPLPQDFFALAAYWRKRAEELVEERDAALIRLTYFLQSHTHQWTDVTTIGDLASHRQKHVCGCGETKITPL